MALMARHHHQAHLGQRAFRLQLANLHIHLALLPAQRFGRRGLHSKIRTGRGLVVCCRGGIETA